PYAARLAGLHDCFGGDVGWRRADAPPGAELPDDHRDAETGELVERGVQVYLPGLAVAVRPVAVDVLVEDDVLLRVAVEHGLGVIDEIVVVLTAAARGDGEI